MAPPQKWETRDGPLSGVRVLDIATIFAAPLAATLLADMGATVIKVEHPRGDNLRSHGHQKDGESLLWKMANRNKLGVTLDFSTPEGAAALLKMAADVDVIIENFRPGTLERWGLGWDELHAVNPGLVLVRVTGFGQTGPYSDRPGFGTLAEAMSGFAYVTGSPDGPPTLPPFGLADGICGITAAWATVSALYWRDTRGGEGQVIDMALYEPLLTVLGSQPTVFDQLGIVQERNGNRSVNNAPRNTYRTSDGKWLAISTSADSVARRLIGLVGGEQFLDQPWFGSAHGRVAHVEELDGAVSDWIAARSQAEVMEACGAAGVAVIPIYSVEDVVADPHVQARGSLTTVEDPKLGPLLMQDVIARLSETPGSVESPGPGLGEHNDLVLKGWYGIDVEQPEIIGGSRA